MRLISPLIRKCFLLAVLIQWPLLATASALPRNPLPSLPPLEWLEQAALKRAALNPERIEFWNKNARRAVALPRIQVGFEQNALIKNTAIIQDSVSVTSGGVVVGPESNRLDQDFGSDRGFEVKAVWALDELLFNRSQLDISREARDLYFVRTQLLQNLQQSYFELKTQMLRLQLEPALGNDPLERIKTEQLVEKLNSLSGGEFKRWMSDKRKPS